MLMTREPGLSFRTLRGWAISVLQEAGANMHLDCFLTAIGLGYSLCRQTCPA
jgi:hypothetical protein